MFKISWWENTLLAKGFGAIKRCKIIQTIALMILISSGNPLLNTFFCVRALLIYRIYRIKITMLRRFKNFQNSYCYNYFFRWLSGNCFASQSQSNRKSMFNCLINKSRRLLWKWKKIQHQRFKVLQMQNFVSLFFF